MLEQVLIDSKFTHVRTFGKKKEYERTIGKQKMRVRPVAKKVEITYEYDKGLTRDITTKRVTEDKAIQIVVAFDVMSEMYE